MESCIRCNVSEEEVRLFNAVYEGRMSSICERCSIIENIPIIKKPNSSQLKESEQNSGVYDRMKRLAGIKDIEKQETFFREDRLKELDDNPLLEIPEKTKLNLIDHFHWEIMKNRRRKGLSQKQLAEEIGESEIVIQMLEKENLPENSERTISKLEQFFLIKLRKISEVEKIFKAKQSGPVLLDESGYELDKVPELEFEIQEPAPPEDKEELDYDKEDFEERKLGLDEDSTEEIEVEERPELPLKDLDIRDLDFDDVTIGDLQTLNRKKVEVSKQERVEEQRRIEERQHIIEARREEIRLKKEKESDDLDEVLGGVELLDDGSI